jgi:hypothetical protein
MSPKVRNQFQADHNEIGYQRPELLAQISGPELLSHHIYTPKLEVPGSTMESAQ